MKNKKNGLDKTGLNPQFSMDAKPYFRKEMENPEFYEGYEEESLRLQIAVSIHKARKAKKISQEKLAQDAHTNQKVISRIEHGEVSVGVDLLQRIASALDLKVKLSFS